ncbi:hypothetical protein E1J17_07395, partial [Kocuria rosea]
SDARRGRGAALAAAPAAGTPTAVAPTAGSGTAGSGTFGSGTVGSGTAGSGTAGSVAVGAVTPGPGGVLGAGLGTRKVRGAVRGPREKVRFRLGGLLGRRGSVRRLGAVVGSAPAARREHHEDAGGQDGAGADGTCREHDLTGRPRSSGCRHRYAGSPWSWIPFSSPGARVPTLIGEHDGTGVTTA